VRASKSHELSEGGGRSEKYWLRKKLIGAIGEKKPFSNK